MKKQTRNPKPEARATDRPVDLLQINMAIVQTRKEKMFPDLSDADFAAMIGVTPATFCDYKSETKKALPSLPVALAMALLLKLDLRKLVANADEIVNRLKQKAKSEPFFA